MAPNSLVVPRAYRRKLRRFTTGRLVWGGLLRVLQRITHYKHGDHLEFKLGFSVHDLSERGRAARAQVEALVQAVQKAGSYQKREEAARAVHAVWAGLKDKLPPDVLSKVAEALPLREAAHLGRSSSQHQVVPATTPAATASPAVEPPTASTAVESLALDDPQGSQPRDAG